MQLRHGKGARAAKGSLVAMSALAGATSAAPLQVKLGDAKSCSPMSIEWDTTGGTAPWTVSIVPTNHVSTTLTFPSGYTSDKTWSYDWDVPGFKDSGSSVIVGVSDASGKVAGVSQFQPISTGGSCSAPSESLDFVWFGPETSPRACSAWPIQWQEDASNNGIGDPVSVTFLPEGGVPSTYTASKGDKKFDWQVSYPRGTRFTVAMTDNGKSGSGGVGLIYTVSSARGSASCDAANPGLTQGLMAATSSVPKQATPASSNAAHKATSTSSKGNTSQKSGQPRNPSADDAAKEENSSSNGGAIAGGIIGALLGISLIAGAIFWWKRKRGQDEKSKPFDDQFVSPWRYEVDGQPASGSGGRFRAMSSMFSAMAGPKKSAAAEDSYARGYGANDTTGLVAANRLDGQAETSSIGSVYPATAAGMHRRTPSQFGASSGHGAPPSTRTTRTNRSRAPSVHSTVPDDALFPPPAPRVVPDDALFPPLASRAPSSLASRSNIGTPIGGVGAGVGSGMAPAEEAPLNPSQRSSELIGKRESRSPRQGRGARASELDVLERTLKRERDAAHPPSSSHTDHETALHVRRESARSVEDDVTTRYHPVGKTSALDPYTHMSTLYDDAEVASRLKQYEATRKQGEGAKAKASSPATRAGGLPTPLNNLPSRSPPEVACEVMMPTSPFRDPPKTYTAQRLYDTQMQQVQPQLQARQVSESWEEQKRRQQREFEQQQQQSRQYQSKPALAPHGPAPGGPKIFRSQADIRRSSVSSIDSADGLAYL
ncbi:hypothetical protein IE81DRAFT_346759 [Ceraceosorus guamensis]|uniref:Uncharacterized protein n=1 Tax=Ceraceosorus guamensis TaxID=1522189 RepID=A0A316W055_9BASI|nr:hypothetical protein IE81DRAFT_346759 [Ceraceosorus guamensis]PWN43160.1 hypothetical protein IE81DRAFT_346759 [Ceraceosorus guamensis]